MSIDGIKVYEFNDCDTVVTKLSLEDTKKWYNNITGEIPDSENVDIYNEGMYYDSIDFNYAKLHSEKVVDYSNNDKPLFGNIVYFDYDRSFLEYISIREAIDRELKTNPYAFDNEPIVIASTEI